ncbi:hypothetical protein BJ912DRAFT_603402 [Pholiota molesta]|nr:hypothetical protein BJ912DRAFT_603402 [Pholiota molesta]
MPNPSNSLLSSPPSSISTSPVKEPVYISPMKKVPLKQSPVKLRHPSRLHTADLTANTFRLYLKHYMDGAPNDDSIADLPTTPTKRPRSDETPRASLRYQSYSDATPRRIPQPDFGLEPSSSRTLAPEPTPARALKAIRSGFTLAYLRRVPELSLLASRVVDAVSRRRVRAELKKLKESGLPLPCPAPSARLSAAQKHARVKELFRWAVIKHLREGCLVIWDGPVRRCSDIPITSVSRLWKSNASASTAGGNSTLFSSTLGSLPSFLTEENDDDDEGALSDPDPNEEAYVSLTPEFMADYVEDAIKMLVERKVAARNPYAGATKEEILDVLRNDDRWQYVGTWMVDDALKSLEAESRVWQMGRGKWDLTV